VPIDGTVNDPYPFKVLIGRDNLTANGIDIPDVAGAVVSGTASGDWTLSCVRGQIRSVTFVFEADGTAAETERVMWLRYVAAAKGWAFHTAHSTSESAAVALTLLAKELYDDETLLTGVLGAGSSAPSSAPTIPPITSQCSSLAEFISLVERSHAAFLRLVRIEHAGTVLWRRASCTLAPSTAVSHSLPPRGAPSAPHG
jgi:hypothetical protein